MRNRQKCSVLFYLFLIIIDAGSTFNIIGINKQMLYEYEGNVAVGAKAPQDDEHPAPPSSGWVVRGKLTLQRQSLETLAAALSIDEVRLNNSGEKFLQNKEMYPPYKPFKIVLTKEGTISHLLFKDNDPIWSTNLKRAIASTLQFQMKSVGAFVVDETGIHGKCSTEYFVSNKTNYISIRKTPELKTCTPHSEAVHITRSNVPPNLCEFDFQKNVIIGNEAVYGLLPHKDTEYFLSMAHVRGNTLIHTFESTGEAQYINSELLLNFLNETTIDIPIDIETAMATTPSGLELFPLDPNDPTGGRHPQMQEALITTASDMLNSLAEGLESSDLKFGEPYDSTLSDIIKVLSQMDYQSLQKLYTEVDIGTSYRQETIRNIFYEIIPRIGTKASVLLTRDLVMEKQIKSTTAVQLLVSLPFHIFELSKDLVKECEAFLSLGPDRPEVRQAAILSFATLVHNVFVGRGISKDLFDMFVQKYFNLFLNEHDYENKMLYLQGLSNLQLGNVANYLDPIVNNEGEDDDIKFLAAWATLPLATTRPDKIYEIYWPIFESKNATLELRVAAVTLLLISNPTPARLISIHRIIQSETCRHMINYYRTTITSISETTFPCYQHLRRLLSYMHRHLPQKPEPRYWVTGNYIFDYRDSKFGIGAMLQAFVVGDPISDLPVVMYFKFDTEALGKFTGQLALYIKARGLPDAVIGRLMKPEANTIKFADLKTILELLKAPRIESKPLHLELIVQMEGKSVLSFYLNQQSYMNLSYQDLMSRLSFLIATDSHINMQTVRWPFMTKYAVPTVLGTAADVLLQTTVLTSLRGNITQHTLPDAIKRTHQIDARYSSYASCRSRSYNPFLNLDHEINREQGFLIYIPFNNDVVLNITSVCLKYSFSRPEKLTSGMSFKSRSLTSTKGFITKSSIQPFEELILPERKQGVFQLFKYDSDDLGVSLAVNTNHNELIKYCGMLLKSEFMENGFSRSSIINILMHVFGVAQLSSIHLGHDRNFSLLVTNEKSTKIEGCFCNTQIINGDDNVGQHFDFTMIHTDDVSNDILHKWNTTMDFKQSTKTKWYNVIGNIERTTGSDDNGWKACLNFTYSPLVFTKRPHTLDGKVIFGKSSGEQSCPNDTSTVIMIATAGPSEHAHQYFLNDTELIDTNYCPKEVLKFSPIPTSKYCKRINFENFTSITRYGIDLKFSEMPEWFALWSNRLDHLVSALSSKKVERLNLDKELDVSIKTPNDNFQLIIGVNNVTWSTYDIPLLQKLDSKYDISEQLSYDTGLKRSCSIINGMVNTFDDHPLNLSDYFQRNGSCTTLLAADCSTQPKMAIFLIPPMDAEQSNFGLKIHFGENFLTFNPQTNVSTQGPVYIGLNNTYKVDVRPSPFHYPADKKDFEFRVGVNEQNILNIEHNSMKSTIQFDMNNLLNLEIYGVFKSKICGLCSKPLNRMPGYTICA
ncbi:uncharacterized protein LOC129915809 [Episyrphus balteatus]|uniref:uncharacterized protein LOC129915809 n=1 Tax=Episyrphus balteatus TaxID=286459 RepID=UPI002484E849|nr:uncharacterized protein LOC129915809 [Episyrphus balteatus]